MSLVDDVEGLAPSEATARYSIRAVDRVLDILEVLGRAEGGTSLGAVSKAIGLPKSSVFRYLCTLERRGRVIRDGAEIFRLSAGRDHMRPQEVARLGAIARPRMEELCRRFAETINLGTIDGHRIIYLEVVESPKAMRFAASRGSSDPIHSSALGKIISSSLTESEVLEILAIEGMPAITARTITDPDRFLEEIGSARQRRFAVDDGENEEGGRCIAVGLPHVFGAAMSLSAPAARLPEAGLDEVATILEAAAADIGQEFRNAGS